MSTTVASMPAARKRQRAIPAATLSRTTCIGDAQSIHVPAWVKDLDSFRRWATSDELPEKTRVMYLHGEIWMDLTMEQLFTHNGVKTEYASVLHSLCKKNALGRYFSDGVLVSNVSADLSAVPEGVFVATASLELGRVRLVPGKVTGFVELEGTPDMVLEVVSASSWEKDLVTLRELYWQAGISEYWLVDARGETLQFDILRHAAKGYVPARKRDGWVKSAAFGSSFKLTRQEDKLGHPEFTVQVK